MKGIHVSLALLALVNLNDCAKKSKKTGNPGSETQPSAQPSPEAAAASTNKRFLASNVLLGLQSLALAQDEEKAELDPNTKVRPEQIQLSEDDKVTIGRLKSKNLRDALQNEVAPKLADVIVGRWNVSSADLLPSRPTRLPPQFDALNSALEVRNDGTISLESGCLYGVHRFLCKGYGAYQDGRSIVETACHASDLSNPTFKVYSNSILVIKTTDTASSANGSCNTASPVPRKQTAALVVAELTQDKIILFNSSVDSDSSDEYPEVMTLTRVP